MAKVSWKDLKFIIFIIRFFFVCFFSLGGFVRSTNAVLSVNSVTVYSVQPTSILEVNCKLDAVIHLHIS